LYAPLFLPLPPLKPSPQPNTLPQVTIQPFRKELDRVIATYLIDDAPRQLNLSDHEQKAALHALSFTTHPSAFRLVARQVEDSLRQQAHPNFIRWSICNGNPARVTFAQGLGVGMVLAGLVVAVLLTLSGAGRGYRALAAVAWVVGFATMVAGWKGMVRSFSFFLSFFSPSPLSLCYGLKLTYMLLLNKKRLANRTTTKQCVVLHGLHHRHIRPWELFVSELDGDEDDLVHTTKGSFDSFGSANSYEDEPWVVRYRRRNIVRKVFDRQVWVEEPALRQVQDTIFVQSILFGVVCAGLLTAVFVAVPGGDLF
jgi:hypothetical protein